MTSDDSVGNAIKRESVELVFLIVGTVAVAAVTTTLSDPTLWGRIKMGTARYVYRESRRASLALLNLADKADDFYERSRSV